MPSNHLMLCHPVLLLPSIFPSNWVFSNELALLIRWPEYWSFSINPFNEYSGLISFRVDWFYFLAVPWTLKSLLQHHNSKASILRHCLGLSYLFFQGARVFSFCASVTGYSAFGAKKLKSANISTFPLSICHEVIGPDAMILVFFSLSNSLAVQWFGICGLDPAVGWV